MTAHPDSISGWRSLAQRPDLERCPKCGRHALPGTHRERLEERGGEVVAVDCRGEVKP